MYTIRCPRGFRAGRKIAALLIAALALSLIAAGVLGAGTAAADTPTTGTWALYPEQTFTEETVVTEGTAYETRVRPPIREDETSVFTGKRGVIPVQFDLYSAPTTTRTVTRTYDPVVFESDFSNSDAADDFAFLSLTFADPTVTFGDIFNLSAVYTYTDGNCGGGALRWSVRIDENGNNIIDASDGSVHIYYGDYPNFTDCITPLNNQTGQNMIGKPDLRYDTSAVGGTFYDSYLGALALVGTKRAFRATIALDTGWFPDNATGRDEVLPTAVTVNDNTFVPKTVEQDVTTETGPLARTCDLPQAKLRYSKDVAPLPALAVFMAESIQPKDDGEYYRRVDCKYIYNLDVSSLQGPGRYRVYANINGMNVDKPAVFYLM
jgi:hypothetical protein